jgi:salicylate hydroxylase
MVSVVVTGAGIGGLTAALGLAQAGVDVTLFDRAPVLHEVGAGLQLSPNATGALARLGLLDRIRETAVRPDHVRVRRGRDGTDLARLPLGDIAEARFGAPFLVTHRADLQAALLDAARANERVTLMTGHTVERFVEDGDKVAVSLRSGTETRTLMAHGLVGADGLRSRIRSALNPGRHDDRIFCGRTAWRALIPAAQAPAASLLPLSNLWLGRKLHMVHYPVRGGALVNVVAIVEDRWRGDTSETLWTVHGDPAELRGKFAGWAAEARALIEAAPEWRIWPLFDRPPLREWSSGAVTLMGDAAHPMLPFLAQGASQAIEDGWVLGQAVQRRPRLADAFRLYEQVRRPKADRAQRESRRQGRIYHLGSAGAQLRDAALRLMGQDRMLARFDWLYRLESQVR